MVGSQDRIGAVIPDLRNSKEFLNLIKTVFGPPKLNAVPLLSSGGITLLNDIGDITEHLSTLLNKHSTVDTVTLNAIAQKPTQGHLDIFSTLDEVKKTIGQTSTCEASGKDDIHAALLKAVSLKTFVAFHSTLARIWKEEVMLYDFRDATVASLYKNKAVEHIVGIIGVSSLLSVAEKILT